LKTRPGFVVTRVPGWRRYSAFGESDPAQLGKVSKASVTHSAGVDGGVGKGNLGEVLAAGATYVVIGRRHFPDTAPSSKEEPE
jgi:hypothetical protein